MCNQNLNLAPSLANYQVSAIASIVTDHAALDMTTHYLFDTKPYFEGRWKSKWTLLGVYIIWKRREKVLKSLRKNGWKVTLWQWKGIWCISLQCVCDASVFAFCLLQFDSDYEEFKQSIDGLKQQLQMFVDSWFEKPLSVSVFFSPNCLVSWLVT